MPSLHKTKCTTFAGALHDYMSQLMSRGYDAYYASQIAVVKIQQDVRETGVSYAC